MKELCILLWICVVAVCQQSLVYSMPMYTGDSLDQSEDSLTREIYLIKILQNLDENDVEIRQNKPTRENIMNDNIINTKKRHYETGDTMESVIIPSKRDYVSGVLPPWNEFCRMMRITHCFHSRQS